MPHYGAVPEERWGKVEASMRYGSAPSSGEPRPPVRPRGCVQVDLVAEAGAERLDGLGRVVAAPVEAPVHDRLDAAPDGPEDRGRGHVVDARPGWDVVEVGADHHNPVGIPARDLGDHIPGRDPILHQMGLHATTIG